MQCILYKIYFFGSFHIYYNLICIFLYALLFAQNFILVKSGCYTFIPNEDCLAASIVKLLQAWARVLDMSDALEHAEEVHHWCLTMPGFGGCRPVHDTCR
jgi:hypothetical protein